MARYAKMLDLDAIKKREDAATPGPWHCTGCGDDAVIVQTNHIALTIPRTHDDMTFIAHAREDVPALVAEVTKLRRVLQRVVTCSDCAWARDMARKALANK